MLYHSTLGSRVIKKKRKKKRVENALLLPAQIRVRPLRIRLHQPVFEGKFQGSGARGQRVENALLLPIQIRVRPLCVRPNQPAFERFIVTKILHHRAFHCYENTQSCSSVSLLRRYSIIFGSFMVKFHCWADIRVSFLRENCSSVSLIRRYSTMFESFMVHRMLDHVPSGVRGGIYFLEGNRGCSSPCRPASGSTGFARMSPQKCEAVPRRART